MEIIDVNPQDCIRWKFADRSGFEFGDTHLLAEDIRKYGQIEPVILRISQDPQYKYEIIAGSRRWKACLEAGIPLKGIVRELSDEQAAIAQIKENQHLPICDYSKGIYYARLLKEKKITVARLAESVGCSTTKLQNFLTFEKVPQTIWNAVGNLSKVSARTARVIYNLSQKGKKYVEALINQAEEIRKGLGSRTLERKVLNSVHGGINEGKETISLPSGEIIAHWTKDSIRFTMDIPFDKRDLEKVIVGYFRKATRNKPKT